MTIRLKPKHILAALLLGFLTWKAIPVIGYFTSKTIHWKQEAPLHDGRMLIVDRISKLSPSNPFDLSMRMEIEQRLTFTHPDTGKRISWSTPRGLLPVMIDFEHDIPYFVLLASDYSGWGCPNPPYLVYRYQEGQWKHLNFKELPVSLENRNLIVQSKAAYSGKGILPDESYVSAAVMENFWERFSGSMEETNGTQRLSRKTIQMNLPVQECGVDVLVALGRATEIDDKSWKKYKQELEREKREITPENRLYFQKQGEEYINSLKQKLGELR